MATPDASRFKESADTAPKKPPAAKKAAGSRGPGRPSNKTRAADLRQPISQLVGMGSLAMMSAAAMAGDEYRQAQLAYDAQIVAANADKLATQLVDLAADHPGMLRVLESVMATSKWSGLVSTAAAIGVPILANHGAIPPGVTAMVDAPAPPERPAAPVVPIRRPTGMPEPAPGPVTDDTPPARRTKKADDPPPAPPAPPASESDAMPSADHNPLGSDAS